VLTNNVYITQSLIKSMFYKNKDVCMMNLFGMVTETQPFDEVDVVYNSLVKSNTYILTFCNFRQDETKKTGTN
jgi:hypothetical protein